MSKAAIGNLILGCRELCGVRLTHVDTGEQIEVSIAALRGRKARLRLVASRLWHIDRIDAAGGAEVRP